MDESEFVRTILDESGAMLLVDVSNLHANACSPAPTRIAAVFGALAVILASGACSQEQLAREAEARAKKWGAPVVLKGIDAPGSHGFWGDPYHFPETRRHAIEFLRRYLKVAA